MDSIEKVFSFDTEPQKIDELIVEHGVMASKRIDCLSCANCCKTYSPIIETNEISTISKGLQVDSETLFRDYIEMDEEGDFVFRMQPCPMLDTANNHCKIYNDRPYACRDYPHLTGGNFRKRKQVLVKNYELCPIVKECFDSIALKI